MGRLELVTAHRVKSNGSKIVQSFVLCYFGICQGLGHFSFLARSQPFTESRRCSGLEGLVDEAYVATEMLMSWCSTGVSSSRFRFDHDSNSLALRILKFCFWSICVVRAWAELCHRRLLTWQNGKPLFSFRRAYLRSINSVFHRSQEHRLKKSLLFSVPSAPTNKKSVSLQSVSVSRFLGWGKSRPGCHDRTWSPCVPRLSPETFVLQSIWVKPDSNSVCVKHVVF